MEEDKLRESAQDETRAQIVWDFLTSEEKGKLSRLHQFIALIAFIVFNLLGSYLIGRYSIEKDSVWLDTLYQPDFRPPDWLFAPVWTVIYILVALSAWLVYRKRLLNGHRAASFIVQTVGNFLWVPLFLGWNLIFIGMIDIILVLISIIWMMVAFKPVHIAATIVLLPYLLWETFILCLNASIFKLNFERYGYWTRNSTLLEEHA